MRDEVPQRVRWEDHAQETRRNRSDRCRGQEDRRDSNSGSAGAQMSNLFQGCINNIDQAFSYVGN
jgi:hypothetical protein